MATMARQDRPRVQMPVAWDVRALISAKVQIDIDEIAGEMMLGDMGFDSLALSDLAEAIEEKFDVQVPNRTLPATLTVDQLSALLLRSLENAENGAVTAEPAD